MFNSTYNDLKGLFMLSYEKEELKLGNKIIAGMDEAGRGPLAGPVVVALVVMPLDKEFIIEGINDSKKLSEKKREMLYEKIIDTALYYSIQIIDEKTIDEINILQATIKGMKQCITSLNVTPDVVLVDAVKFDSQVKTVPIIKGDAKSYSIAAASILAKVTRDRLMVEYAKDYPNFDFAKHKGYGTKKHIEELKTFGPTEIHRKTFITHFV